MKQRVEPRPVRALALQRGRSLLATLVEMTFAPPFRPPPPVISASPRHFGLPPSFRPPPVISASPPSFRAKRETSPAAARTKRHPTKLPEALAIPGAQHAARNVSGAKKGAPIMGAPLFTLGMPGAYSCGPAATSALPASLVSYFLKLLMKRSARSCALASHSAGSA